MLTGGYTHVMAEDQLVDLHMKTVQAFSSAGSVPSDEETLAVEVVQR